MRRGEEEGRGDREGRNKVMHRFYINPGRLMFCLKKNCLNYVFFFPWSLSEARVGYQKNPDFPPKNYHFFGLDRNSAW